jgi:hypothetical protein
LDLDGAIGGMSTSNSSNSLRIHLQFDTTHVWGWGKGRKEFVHSSVATATHGHRYAHGPARRRVPANLVERYFPNAGHQVIIFSTMEYLVPVGVLPFPAPADPADTH